MLARSIIYLLISWLALQVALGHRAREADQNGALASIAARTGGRIGLAVLAAAFGCYALWRLSVVFFGDAGTRDFRTRLEGAIGFVGYGGLCITAISFALASGDRSRGSARQATSLTARIMNHSGGRVAVVVVGLAVVVAGALLLVQGIRRSFMDQLRTDRMSPVTRRAVARIGVVGNVARGVVIALVGLLLMDAGVTFKPQKSRGLDGALQTLAHATAGPWLLGAIALGFLSFAVYSAAESRYRRT